MKKMFEDRGSILDLFILQPFGDRKLQLNNVSKMQWWQNLLLILSMPKNNKSKSHMKNCSSVMHTFSKQQYYWFWKTEIYRLFEEKIFIYETESTLVFGNWAYNSCNQVFKFFANHWNNYMSIKIIYKVHRSVFKILCSYGGTLVSYFKFWIENMSYYI